MYKSYYYLLKMLQTSLKKVRDTYDNTRDAIIIAMYQLLYNIIAICVARKAKK